MKKKILSIVMMLAIALSLAVGTAVMAGATTEADMALNLADAITAEISFSGIGATASTAEVTVAGHRVNATVTKSGDDAIVSIPLAVKEIDSEISVVVKDSSSQKIADKTTTAKAYLDNVSDSLYAPLAQALVSYGAAAKNYFDETDLVTPPTDDPDFGDSTIAMAGSVPGLSHYSASLILENRTTIRHYFALSAGYDISSYTFFVDYDLDGGYDADEELTPFENGDHYCVDIKGITPNDIDKQYTIYVAMGKTTYSCTYGALDYAKRVYAKADTNATKSLLAALNDYVGAASSVGADIIYMDGAAEISGSRGFYNYGVDNYLNYLPTKTGYNFMGWTDAAGEKVNVITAGTTGDVTLYATWEINTLPNFTTDICSGINSAVASSVTKIDNRKTNGTLTYSTDSFEKASTYYGDCATTQTLWNCIKDIDEDNRVFDMTFRFAKSGDTTVMPLTLRNNNGYFFAIADDGNVYLGATQSNTYKIATLTNELTDVKIRVNLTEMTSTTGSVHKVTVSATNLSGAEVSVSWNGALSDRKYLGQFIVGSFSGASFTTEGKACALTVASKVEISTAYVNKVISDDIAVVSEYNTFEAQRLPEGAYKVGYNFEGWYSDAELTQSINSIPAGNAGNVKVYPKWTAISNELISEVSLGNTTNLEHTTSSPGKYGTIASENGGYLTFRYYANKADNDTSTTRWIRLMNRYSQLDYALPIIYLVGDTILSGHGTASKRVEIGSYSSQDVIDVVLKFDFETGKLACKYYTNGVHVKEADIECTIINATTIETTGGTMTMNNACENYDFYQRSVPSGSSTPYELNYFWQIYPNSSVTSKHAVSIYAGNIYG